MAVRMKLPTWGKRPTNARDLHAANVPRRKWKTTLDQVPTDGSTTYMPVILGYIESLKENLEQGNGLLLHGPYRSGKSSLAACIVRHVAAHKARPYWLESFELADGWLAEDERYDQIRQAHLLVVDDLGMEGNADFRRELVARSLRYRLEREGATIITTNMSPAQLSDYYGPKLLALLRECCVAVEIKGVDWLQERT
jgi:DNA replication protein DnaC